MIRSYHYLISRGGVNNSKLFMRIKWLFASSYSQLFATQLNNQLLLKKGYNNMHSKLCYFVVVSLYKKIQELKDENSVCVLFVNAKKPTNTIKSRSETATAIRPHVPVTSTIGVSLMLPYLTHSGVSARTRLVVSWSVTCLLLHNSFSLLSS